MLSPLIRLQRIELFLLNVFFPLVHQSIIIINNSLYAIIVLFKHVGLDIPIFVCLYVIVYVDGGLWWCA